MRKRASNQGTFRSNHLSQAVVSATAMLCSSAVMAEVIDIPAQPLDQAVTQLAQKTGFKIGGDSSLLEGKASQAVRGSLTPQQALSKMLSGSGVAFEFVGENAVILRKAAGTEVLNPVTVKGQTSRFGDAPPEPDGFKAEYQTTATKMAMSIKETPQAISVVTRDLLDARQAKELSTALETSSSVSNSDNGVGIGTGPGMFGGQGQYTQKFVLRGQPGSVRNDGFKVGTTNIDLAAYERVEVVKGPSGFYGQGSLGGFINMVRKKPKQDFDANISTQIGSFDTYRTEFDVTGALNDEQTLLGRMDFVYEDSNSYVQGLDSKRIVIAPSIEAVIDDRTRVLAQLLYQRDDFHANPGVPLEIIGDRVQSFDVLSDRRKVYGVIDEKSNTEVLDLTLRVDHQLSDRWLVSLLLQNNRSKKDTITPSYVSSDSGSFYVYSNKDSWDRNYLAGELRLQGEFDAFGQTHQVLVGVEQNRASKPRHWGSTYASPNEIPYASSTGDFSSFASFSADEIPLEISRDIITKNRAIYAQTVMSLTDKTNLLVGGRFDKVTESVTNYLDPSRKNDPLDESAFTGKIGLSHAINSNITAYGVWAESFEPSWGKDEDGSLPPITGTGYELGLKSDWLDKRLGVSLSLYRHELTNSPVSDPQDNNFQIATGKHRTDGIELEVAGSPYPGWNIAAAYTWMDNEFLESDDPYFGLSIDGSVDRQLGIYAQYEFQGGRFKGLGIGASYINVGDRHFVNTPFSGSYSQIDLEGYERLDLNFAYKGIPNWDLNFLVRNVTDEHYIESAASIYAWNYYGSPRAALFTANYNF